MKINKLFPSQFYKFSITTKRNFATEDLETTENCSESRSVQIHLLNTNTYNNTTTPSPPPPLWNMKNILISILIKAMIKWCFENSKKKIEIDWFTIRINLFSKMREESHFYQSNI